MGAAISNVRYDEFETYPLLVETNHSGGSMLAIPTTSRDPARAVMFINELHTNDEIVNLIAWGIEGLTYEVVSETPRKIVRVIEGSTWRGNVINWTLGNFFAHFLDENEEIDVKEQLYATKSGVPDHIALGFRFDPANYLDAMAAVDSALDERDRALRIGAIDISEVAAHIAAAEAAGFRDIQAAVQSQFDAWFAANR